MGVGEPVPDQRGGHLPGRVRAADVRVGVVDRDDVTTDDALELPAGALGLGELRHGGGGYGAPLRLRVVQLLVVARLDELLLLVRDLAALELRLRSSSASSSSPSRTQMFEIQSQSRNTIGPASAP